MKIISVLFTLFIALLSNAQNVAYIHQDSLLSALPNYKMNIVKLDSLQKEYTKEI